MMMAETHGDAPFARACTVGSLPVTDVENGLTSAQVEDSRRHHGWNELPQDKPKPFIYFLAREFVKPLVIILLILLAISAYLLGNQMQINRELVASGKKAKPIDTTQIGKMVIIGIVVTLLTTLNALGKSRSGKALQALAQLAGSQKAAVKREGKRTEVPIRELVVGDLVFVKSGDSIPADLAVIEASDLSVVEATLTGEPTEVRKGTTNSDPSAPFRSNVLYASTSVVSGSGVGVCRAVGHGTAVGSIARKLETTEGAVDSPTDKTMTRLGNGLMFLVSVALLVMALVIWKTAQYDVAKYQGSDFLAVVFESLSIATMCLPTTLGLSLVLNMQKGMIFLTRRNALVRKFTAVEVLGCTTVICSDKTGTLTEGKMTAVKCCTLTREASSRLKPTACAFHPTRGFNPAGGLFLEAELAGKQALVDRRVADGRPLGSQDSAELRIEGLSNLGDAVTAATMGPLPRALTAAAFLNSDPETAILKKADGEYACVGNMSEAALVVAGAKVGLWKDGAAGLGKPYENGFAAYPAIRPLEVPFTSGRKMKMTVHGIKGNNFLGVPLPPGVDHVAIVKGAPDRVGPHVTQLLSTDLRSLSSVDEEARTELARLNHAYAASGLRVLTVGVLLLGAGELDALRGLGEADDRLQWALQRGLVLLGLVGLEDPPRESVADAVLQCHSAGIKVVMITGDQVATAASIAGKINIARKGEDASALSHECKALHTDPDDPAGSAFVDDAQVDELSANATVWARAQPVDKIALVESLQRQGHTVAMTGDGVNDAAAIKAADMGTAMGISGTDVAKGAADLILLDDNFTTIVEAIRVGRQIYGNLQKYIYYYLGVKCCELVMFMICVCAQLWKPVSGLSGLLGKNVTHDTSPLTLPYEEAEPYQMRVAPRPKNEFIITRLMVWTRLLPQLVYFQLWVLGGSLILAQLFTNSVNPKYSTDKFAAWSDSSAQCIQAYRCSFDALGAASGCSKLENPPICRVPDDHRMGGERSFLYEYGSPEDTYALQDDAAALNKFEADGRIKNGHHDISNDRRTWIPLPGPGMYSLQLPGQAPFLALTRCSASKGLLFSDALGAPPQDYGNLCWTAAATSTFGKDSEKYPYLDPFNNVGAWILRKLQGSTWALFVMVELTHLASCRTERWFWQAPHNIWYYGWMAIVTIFWTVFVNVPDVAKGIGYAPMDGYTCAVAFPAAVGMLICSETCKALYRRRLATQHAQRKAQNVYMNPVGYEAVSPSKTFSPAISPAVSPKLSARSPRPDMHGVVASV